MDNARGAAKTETKDRRAQLSKSNMFLKRASVLLESRSSNLLSVVIGTTPGPGPRPKAMSQPVVERHPGIQSALPAPGDLGERGWELGAGTRGGYAVQSVRNQCLNSEALHTSWTLDR